MNITKIQTKIHDYCANKQDPRSLILRNIFAVGAHVYHLADYCHGNYVLIPNIMYYQNNKIQIDKFINNKYVYGRPIIDIDDGFRVDTKCVLCDLDLNVIAQNFAQLKLASDCIATSVANNKCTVMRTLYNYDTPYFMNCGILYSANFKPMMSNCRIIFNKYVEEKCPARKIAKIYYLPDLLWGRYTVSKAYMLDGTQMEACIYNGILYYTDSTYVLLPGPE